MKSALTQQKSEITKAPAQDQQFQEMGQQLTAQYDRAIGGMKDIVIFGAMVAKVQKIVSTCGHDRSRGGGRDTKGSGLKAWLAQYAPTVSRARAYEFLKIAEGIRETFHIGAKADLAELLQADPKQLMQAQRRKQEEILEAISGQSRRQLLLNFGGIGIPDADRKARGGKRTSSKDKDPGEDTKEQAAIDYWTPVLRDLHNDIELKLWADLPDDGPVSRRSLKDALLTLSGQLTKAGVK